MKREQRIPSDQQGSTLSDQEEIKGRWKHYTENLHSGNKGRIDTFEEDFYEEEPVIVGREGKVAFEVLGRNKSRVEGLLIELFQATET